MTAHETQLSAPTVEHTPSLYFSMPLKKNKKTRHCSVSTRLLEFREHLEIHHFMSIWNVPTEFAPFFPHIRVILNYSSVQFLDFET